MRFVLIAWFAGLLSACALAQEYPKAELFGGYSYGSAEFTGAGRGNLNGWNGSVTGNVNRWLGVTGDFTGLYGTRDITNTLGAPCPPFCGPFQVRTHAYTFLFGPQISLRTERFTPFAHVLFGVAHTTESVSERISLPLLPPIPSLFSISVSDTSFATALGGGADVGLSRRFAWRIQGDYLQSRVFNATQNNFRVSTGIVFRF